MNRIPPWVWIISILLSLLIFFLLESWFDSMHHERSLYQNIEYAQKELTKQRKFEP